MNGYIDTAKKIGAKGKKAFQKGKEAYIKGKGYYDQYKSKAGEQQTATSSAPPPPPEPSWIEGNGKFILLGAGALLLIVLMRKK